MRLFMSLRQFVDLPFYSRPTSVVTAGVSVFTHKAYFPTIVYAHKVSQTRYSPSKNPFTERETRMKKPREVCFLF